MSKRDDHITFTRLTIACGRYIELNPAKAQIVNEPKEYKWSSYNAYAYGIKNDIVDYNPIYLDWGRTEKDRQNNYRAQIKEVNETINFNARFLGPDEFMKKLERKFKIPNVRTARGRPKKNK